MFEQEYLNVLNEYITVFDTPYQKYLKSTCSDVSAVHKGYFSIDKKTGHSIDSQLKRGSEFSDDISAYDLILKNKERLLSFEEPISRFLYSLLMRLLSIVNMMLMVMKSLENMDRCLSRNI